MPQFVSFHTTVALRTAVAEHLLQEPELLGAFEQVGGRCEDLEAIAETGRRASDLHRRRRSATADRAVATIEAKKRLIDLEREHRSVLAVLQVVKHQLERSGPHAEQGALLESVLANDGQRSVRATANARGERVYRSRSREAVRAEIEKDARMLLESLGLHEALSGRGVTVARLEALRQAAAALGQQVTLRTVVEGGRAALQSSERDAVKEQKALWSACYPLLTRAARKSDRIAELLRESARERRRK